MSIVSEYYFDTGAAPVKRKRIDDDLSDLNEDELRESFFNAIRLNKIEIVRKIIQDRRLDISIEENFGLYDSIRRGYYDLTLLLLRNMPDNATYEFGKMIVAAVENERTEILEMLLNHAGILEDLNQEAMEFMVEQEDFDSIKMLLLNESVNSVLKWTVFDAFLLSIKYEVHDTIKQFLQWDLLEQYIKDNPRIDRLYRILSNADQISKTLVLNSEIFKNMIDYEKLNKNYK